MNEFSVFQTTDRCNELIQTIRMRNLFWSVLFAINGERTIFDIARLFRLSSAKTEEIFQHLVTLELIEETEISLAQYTMNQGRGADADATATLDEFLMSRAVPPKEIPSTPTPAAAPSAAPATAVLPALPPVPEAPVAKKLPPIPPREKINPVAELPVSPASSGRIRLKALIDFIVSQAPSATEGQIAVYRAFLRVPSALMKKNGIVSLSLVNDESIVADSELLKALEAAVETTLKMSIPESVYC